MMGFDEFSFLPFFPVHYRTRRTFKSNLRILANINMGFVNILVRIIIMTYL